MPRLLPRLFSCVLLVVLTCSAAPAQAAPRDGQGEQSPNGLRMLGDAPGVVQGVSQQAAGTARFTSRSSSGPSLGEKLYDRAVSTEVVVNGDSVNVVLDPVAKTLSYRGSPGSVVSKDDKQVLRDTGTRLAQRLGAPEHPQVNERALALRTLAFLAEAPEGISFPTATAPVTDQMLSPDTCGATGQPPASAVAGPQPLRDDRDDEDGIAFLGCHTTRHNTSHDAGPGAHGFRTFYNVVAGTDSGTSNGRCGAAGTPLQFGWTQDCLDHDYCVSHDGGGAGPSGTHCGDEWWEAFDDFNFTLPFQCSRFGFDSDPNPGNAALKRPISLGRPSVPIPN